MLNLQCLENQVKNQVKNAINVKCRQSALCLFIAFHCL